MSYAINVDSVVGRVARHLYPSTQTVSKQNERVREMTDLHNPTETYKYIQKHQSNDTQHIFCSGHYCYYNFLCESTMDKSLPILILTQSIHYDLKRKIHFVNSNSAWYIIVLLYRSWSFPYSSQNLQGRCSLNSLLNKGNSNLRI